MSKTTGEKFRWLNSNKFLSISKGGKDYCLNLIHFQMKNGTLISVLSRIILFSSNYNTYKKNIDSNKANCYEAVMLFKAGLNRV
jgi:hypothetical protein